VGWRGGRSALRGARLPRRRCVRRLPAGGPPAPRLSAPAAGASGGGGPRWAGRHEARRALRALEPVSKPPEAAIGRGSGRGARLDCRVRRRHLPQRGSGTSAGLPLRAPPPAPAPHTNARRVRPPTWSCRPCTSSRRRPWRRSRGWWGPASRAPAGLGGRVEAAAGRRGGSGARMGLLPAALACVAHAARTGAAAAAPPLRRGPSPPKTATTPPPPCRRGSPSSLPRLVSPYTSSVDTLMNRRMVPALRAASSSTCVP
jgi:hypothetical protein